MLCPGRFILVEFVLYSLHPLDALHPSDTLHPLDALSSLNSVQWHLLLRNENSKFKIFQCVSKSPGTNGCFNKIVKNLVPKYIILCKGRLRATIVKSAERVHLILLCYFSDSARCALSADDGHNHPMVLWSKRFEEKL